MSLLAVVFCVLSKGSGLIKNTAEFLLYTFIFPELYNNCGIPLAGFVPLPTQYTSGDTTNTAASELSSSFSNE